ncbi:MAG: hypothetical protein ACREB5_01605 [Sphingomonadaceae bacterium]
MTGNNKRRCLWAPLAVMAGLVLPVAAEAQQFPGVFKGRMSESAARPSGYKQAGYYRVSIRPEGVMSGQICPESKPHRKAIEKIEAGLWDFALKKKNNWGTSLKIEFSSLDGALGGDEKRSFEFGLSKATQTGSGWDGCAGEWGVIEFDSPYVPIKVNNFSGDSRVNINLRAWYGSDADKGRVDALWTGIKAGLGLIPGAPLLLAAVENDARAFAEDKLNGKVMTDYPHKISVKEELKDVAFAIGLPVLQQNGTLSYPAKVNVAVQFLGSVFAEGASFPDMSGADVARVTALLRTPVGNQAKPVEELVDGDIFQSVNQQTTMEGFSSACAGLKKELADTVGLSEVDQMLYLWAMAHRKFGANGLDRIACLADNAHILALAKVTFVSAKSPVSWDVMDGTMRTVAYIARQPDADFPAGILNVFEDNVTISGSPDLIGVNDTSKTVSKTELAALINAKVDRMGCWAPRQGNIDQRFALFDGAERAMPVAQQSDRVSAGIARLEDGTSAVLSFQYSGQRAGGGGKLAYLSISRFGTGELRQEFRKNACGEDWMKPVLDAN